MDVIVQKSAELGVARIVPLLHASFGSAPGPTSGPGRKADKWLQVAIEAVKQWRQPLPARN
jgi:16S rRNA U1498 N3-methylase RsmE